MWFSQLLKSNACLPNADNRLPANGEKRVVNRLRCVDRCALGRLRGGVTPIDCDADMVDEALYSRQLYVMGHAAQRSLATSAVLLIGLSGLGAEIGKNVALAGVRALDVYDAAPATIADLSSAWLIHEEDIGERRAARAVERLGELNPHVKVGEAAIVPSSADDLAKYAVVISVDQPLDEMLRIGDLARVAGVKLICARSLGAFGCVYVDVGEAHEVLDTDGEPAKEALLERIHGKDVSTINEQPHGLQSGDAVSTMKSEERTLDRTHACMDGRPHALIGAVRRSWWHA